MVGPAGVLDRGKGMGWIAWEPVRSRSRPRESAPANGRPADQAPWPGWVLQPSGSAAKASTKSGGSRGPRKRNRQATGDAQAGSRSAFIRPLTAGNWAHRDPREGRGAPRDENRCRETREETLGSANLSTKRQRIAGLARTTAGTSSPPCASRQASHGRRPLRQRERNSPVKNRMRETCTSGSVRGGDGDIPTYSATLREYFRDFWS